MRRVSLVIFLAVFVGVAPASADSTEKELPNGIRLPDEWPPRLTELPTTLPTTPPYLLRPPEIIPVDVGRQLFVDDFLIESTTLERSYHLPEYVAQNPLLKPDRPWEKSTAMPFSDGVWWDPSDRVFKMWYFAHIYTCLAVSKDGLHWDKPALTKDRYLPESNVTPILNGKDAGGVTQRDSGTVWLDLQTTDPTRRFRMTYFRNSVHNCYSHDGKSWKLALPGDDGWDKGGHPQTWDRSTFFFNPFRNVWVYSFRSHEYISGLRGDRARRYAETNDWTARAVPLSQTNLWACADSEDKPWPGYGVRPQLYNLDATPYESLMLGFFTIWHGDCSDRKTPEMRRDAEDDRPKLNNVKIAFSRDGFHWHRPDRRPFLPFTDKKGAWNFGNVQSVGGGCLIVGDKLYFYCSGRSGKHGPGDSAGLATLRRDGFASMDADSRGGQLTTRRILFSGKHAFVNVDCPEGELRVEVLDEKGSVIHGLASADCVPIAADSTMQRLTWRSSDLAALAGKPVRLRFKLRSGKLYAFWVSTEASGTSNGYVAAGGPGFVTNRDTIEKSAYDP